MANSTIGFQGLTLTAVPVTTFAGALNTGSLVAGTTIVAAVIDPASGINRVYNPYLVGFTPQTGDASSVWLPKLTAISATSVFDAYWVPAGQAGSSKLGAIKMTLTPGTSDTVRASSVMQFQVSQSAFVLTNNSGTATF